MESKEFNYSKLFILGLGFFGISIIWALYNAYVPIFLKDFALSSLVIGFIMTIDNIFAIIMLPYIGALSDQTRTRLGRRMPYILLGAPIAALFFFLIPISRGLHSLFLMMLTIIVMNFAMALFRSPVIALMPDITPSKYRSQANGIINFMGGVGALLVYFIGKPLYDKHYSLPFYLGALVMLASSLLVVLIIKEPEEYRKKSREKVEIKGIFQKSFGELKDNLKEVFLSEEKSLFFMLLSILLWFIGYNAVETFFTSYMKFQIGIKESTAALIFGFFSLAFMLFAIPAGFIGSKFGRKKTMTVGLLIVIAIIAITLLYGFYITGLPQDAMENAKKNFVFTLFGLFFIGGIGWAMVNVNSLPMVVDMTSEEKLGGYTGLYYFFSMAANIFAPPLSGLFMDIWGYNSLLIFTIVFFFLSVLTLQFVKKGDVK